MFNKYVIEVGAYSPESQNDVDVKTVEAAFSLDKSSESSCCTIEVTGMKKTTSEDTIVLFFESGKGAKADVTNIEFIEYKDMYLVKFEDEKGIFLWSFNYRAKFKG